MERELSVEEVTNKCIAAGQEKLLTAECAEVSLRTLGLASVFG